MTCASDGITPRVIQALIRTLAARCGRNSNRNGHSLHIHSWALERRLSGWITLLGTTCGIPKGRGLQQQASNNTIPTREINK